jgi:hypothetical protein
MTILLKIISVTNENKIQGPKRFIHGIFLDSALKFPKKKSKSKSTSVINKGPFWPGTLDFESPLLQRNLLQHFLASFCKNHGT